VGPREKEKREGTGIKAEMGKEGRERGRKEGRKQWRRYTRAPRSNDLARRSTALAQALAPPCLALRIALLR